MRKTISILILTLFSTALLAQAPDIGVEWGAVMKTKDSHFGSFIGADENHFYTIGSDARGVLRAMMSNGAMIKKYDRKTFRQLDSWEIEEFDYKGKEAVLDHGSLYNGKINLYYKVYNTKLDKKFLIVRTMDEKGRLGKAEELASLTAEKRSEGRFNLVLSRDSTKMLLFSDIPTEKKEKEKFGLQVFDRSNQLLWEKQVTLPYTDKFFSIEDYTITNTGDVMVLGYSMPDKYKGEKKEKKAPNRDYKLLLIDQDKAGEEMTEFDLGLSDKFIKSVSISSDFQNGTMAVAGFYTDDRKGGIGGSFFITLDQETLETKTASTQPFTKEFLKNFMSDRKAEKGEDLHSYVFRDFIQREDGGAVLVAEQHYVYTVTTTTANGGTSSTTYYVYNDIIILNLNPDGTLQWANYIPKRQKTANDGGFYNGYLLMVDGDEMHFVYNDHRKNLERKSDGKDPKGMGNIKKTVSVLATIDSEGKMSFDQLFRNKDFSAILVPRKSFSTNDGKVLIYGIKGSKTRFGKLGFL